jgi:hypothetical protein
LYPSPKKIKMKASVHNLYSCRNFIATYDLLFNVQ